MAQAWLGGSLGQSVSMHPGWGFHPQVRAHMGINK